MKYLLLSFDLEEFDICELNEQERNRISLEGSKTIKELIGNIKCTFFITGIFAERNKEFVKSLAKGGHEVALHGLEHRDDYSILSKEESFERIKKGKEILEGIIKDKVVGFRAPRLRFSHYGVLRDLGIKYDSSFHPTYVPKRYNHFFGKRKVFFRDGVKVIPISVTPVLKVPFSWFWFRNFGLNYSKMCSRLSLMNNNFINIFFHSWEFADLRKSDIGILYKRNTGERLADNLREYIKWCEKSNLKSLKMGDF